MQRAGRVARFVFLGLIVVALQVVSGVLVAAGSTKLALGVLGAAAAVAIVPRGPALLGAFVFPAVYLNQRVAAGSLDLSYADLCLVAGAVLCMFAVPWTHPLLRRIAVVFCVYAAILVVPVMANPTQRALLELGHRAFLVLGSVCVGAAVASSGTTRLALRLYLAASAVVALGAVHETLTNDLRAASPWGINKNAGGFLIAAAIIIVIVAREAVGLWRPAANAVLVVLFAGIAACQSRGAAACLAVVLVLSVVRLRRRTLMVPLVGVFALGAMAWVTLENQAKTDYEREYSQYTTLDQRIATFEETLDLWRQNRAFGAGIRFWNDPEVAATYAGGEPHNLLISALGESGVFGVVAVSGFVLSAWFVLRKRRDPLGVCARYLVVAQAVSGLADIYWRAGTGTLPWLVVGLSMVVAQPPPQPAAERTAELEQISG